VDLCLDFPRFLEAVLNKGESSWNRQLLLVMERNGYTEETYFTFSYSPVGNDDGTVGGVFCACTEDTKEVLSERRLTTLRDGNQNSLPICQIKRRCNKIAPKLANKQIMASDSKI
jgi:hypothetical protein